MRYVSRTVVLQRNRVNDLRGIRANDRRRSLMQKGEKDEQNVYVCAVAGQGRGGKSGERNCVRD